MATSTSAAAAALLKEGQRQGQQFIEFVNKTGSPYHAVQAVRDILQKSKKQFTELRETEVDKVQPGSAFYFTRNDSSIAAFVVGDRPADLQAKSAEEKFLIIASHTDSPCLRLRPNCRLSAEGTEQVGVECYGGGLWHTWLDRGLGLAGAVYVKEKTGQVLRKLVHVRKPLVFLPNLAIHLRTNEELAGGLKLNKEKELQPILCTEVYKQLQRLQTAASAPPSPAGSSSSSAAAAGGEGDTSGNKGESTRKRIDSHGEEREKKESKEEEAAARLLHPSSRAKAKMPAALLELLARELNVDQDAILSWDLCLMDATPSRLCGIHEEFVESPRLDNLVSTFTAFEALSACEVPHFTVAVAMGFDNEEIGSTTFAGADSVLARTWLKLVADRLGIDRFEQMLMRSTLLSADMAHAVHPNYPDRQQPQHKPFLQQGVVVKENANQRYATTGWGIACMRELAESQGVPLQEFVVKNDSRCGSTLGPFLAARLGIRTIDVGVPQWAMHSCREICGTLDLAAGAKLYKAFYEKFGKLSEKADDGR